MAREAHRSNIYDRNEAISTECILAHQFAMAGPCLLQSPHFELSFTTTHGLHRFKLISAVHASFAASTYPGDQCQDRT